MLAHQAQSQTQYINKTELIFVKNSAVPKQVQFSDVPSVYKYINSSGILQQDIIKLSHQHILIVAHVAHNTHQQLYNLKKMLFFAILLCACCATIIICSENLKSCLTHHFSSKLCICTHLAHFKTVFCVFFKLRYISSRFTILLQISSPLHQSYKDAVS